MDAQHGPEAGHLRGGPGRPRRGRHDRVVTSSRLRPASWVWPWRCMAVPLTCTRWASGWHRWRPETSCRRPCAQPPRASRTRSPRWSQSTGRRIDRREVWLVADWSVSANGGQPVGRSARCHVRHASSIPDETLRQAFRMLTEEGPLANAALEAEPFDVLLDCPVRLLGRTRPRRSHQLLDWRFCPACGAVSTRPRTAELELLEVRLAPLTRGMNKAGPAAVGSGRSWRRAGAWTPAGRVMWGGATSSCRPAPGD